MFNIYFLNIYTNYLNNIRNTQSDLSDIKFGYSTDISYAVRKWYNNSDNYSLIVIIRNIQSTFGREGRWKGGGFR